MTIVFSEAIKNKNLIFAMRSRAAVARRAHNPKVTGSIPVFATNFHTAKQRLQRIKVLE